MGVLPCAGYVRHPQRSNAATATIKSFAPHLYVNLLQWLVVLDDRSSRHREAQHPRNLRHRWDLAQHLLQIHSFGVTRCSRRNGASVLPQNLAYWGAKQPPEQIGAPVLGRYPRLFSALQEGLEVVTRLLRDEKTRAFQGRFYHLEDGASIRPKSPSGPRILIGGNGPQRTLPLVARYAEVWNGTFLTPAAFGERSARLDDLLRAAGRERESVRRTLMHRVFFGRDEAELERRLARHQGDASLMGKPLGEIVDTMRSHHHAFIGTGEMIREQIAEYRAVGVEELMLQWFDLDDIEGVRAFAEGVLPRRD
ncbi:MAG TPA: LLM class flavin-dependent oxidoreductase [Herpetosiphonaceae bacterium]|nr:LLM class flavin-dependent oxidoreductase [Herpetosiphonaceae bacterium]